MVECLGLTLHESHVAVLLAEGNSVVEVAAVLKIKPSTVRWFLRQINRKLKISRQAQLVRAVLLAAYGESGEAGGPSN